MATRLPQLTADQLDDDQRKLWTAITEVPRVIPAVNESGHLLGPYDVLLRSPRVGVLLGQVGSALRRETELPSRLIELSKLAVAEHWQCAYEWLVHAEVARQLGLSPEIILAIQAGRVPEFEDQTDQVSYQFSTQLLCTGSIDSKTFGLARKVFGDAGSVELIVLVGHYTIVSFILNSFDVPLPAPAPTFGHVDARLHAAQVDRRNDSLSRRLPALRQNDLTEAQRTLWDSVAAKPRPLPSVDDQGHLLGPYDVLLRSPQVGQLVGSFGSAVRAVTDLPKRLLEVAVLATIAHWRCEMLWAGHRPQARAEGIADDVIAAIREGYDPDFGQDANHRAVFTLASELVRTGGLTQATFDDCQDRLGIKGLLQVVLLVGHYCTQSFLLNAGQVPPLGNAEAVWTK